MCNKLLQTHACGHSKSICTTPCGYALKSTQAAPNLNHTTIATVVRSDSIVSGIAPISRSPSRNFSRPHPSSNSPLRVTNVPSAPSSPTHVPAFRFVAPSTPPSTSPVSPVSPSFASSAPPSRFPSPSPAMEVNVEETFCNYYIPRYLVTSKYPCLECYDKEDWKELRARWMENYRLGHPLDKADEVETFSGVAGVLGKTG
ncbi:hypothetical protein E8E11_007967 [Didymella keratinophila]|nr:hypothetical protein E8E11_007967 [Didymella keratinophila]